MLGLHWIGGGSVVYRTRSLHGTLAPVAAPTRRRQPYGRVARRQPRLDRRVRSSVQFRVAGPCTATAFVRAVDARHLGSGARHRVGERAARSSRAQAWGADEEIVRAPPIIAPTLRLAVVHHTAGTNSYSRAQSAAIVRGIEVYHVQGNGWNDIGYNFLVDRFGTVYEGRGGGIDRNVIGAHAQGFNSGTVGVALIGNFMAATPTKAQQDALVRLLAWRLDVAHLDPLSTVVLTSGGNAKFRAGKLVTLRAISGHRDTGPSECPGTRAYALLPALARRVAATGLPKLYAPTAAGSPGTPVRFQARLSSALAVDGRRHRQDRQGRRLGSRNRLAGRLDVAVGGRPEGGLHVDDQRPGSQGRDRDARQERTVAARAALADEPRRHAVGDRPRGGWDRRRRNGRVHSRRHGARDGACPRRGRCRPRHGALRAAAGGQQHVRLAARDVARRPLPPGGHRSCPGRGA